MEQRYLARTPENPHLNAGRRLRGCTRNGVFCNLKVWPQWHISCSKATPPNPSQTVPPTGGLSIQACASLEAIFIEISILCVEQMHQTVGVWKKEIWWFREASRKKGDVRGPLMDEQVLKPLEGREMWEEPLWWVGIGSKAKNCPRIWMQWCSTPRALITQPDESGSDGHSQVHRDSWRVSRAVHSHRWMCGKGVLD